MSLENALRRRIGSHSCGNAIDHSFSRTHSRTSNSNRSGSSVPPSMIDRCRCSQKFSTPLECSSVECTRVRCDVPNPWAQRPQSPSTHCQWQPEPEAATGLRLSRLPVPLAASATHSGCHTRRSLTGWQSLWHQCGPVALTGRLAGCHWQWHWQPECSRTPSDCQCSTRRSGRFAPLAA